MTPGHGITRQPDSSSRRSSSVKQTNKREVFLNDFLKFYLFDRKVGTLPILPYYYLINVRVHNINNVQE